jgi:MOSC domain-containing protein YiiM
MKLISLNVGRSCHVEWHGEAVATSIFKSPVAGPQRVHALGISGDEQADLNVHGGAKKAVYVYPSERYAYWREQLPDTLFPWGAFGENLTIEGLTEDKVYVGDRLAIGTAQFAVTQPRTPCFKLGIRFDRLDMPKRFLASGFSGFYLSVLEEGTIQAGDAIVLTPASLRLMSIATLFRFKAW